MSLSDLALRILISAKDDTGPGLKTARERITSISDQLQRVETVAKRVLDFRLFAGWAKDGIQLADTYKTLQGRLRLVSDSTQEFNKAQTDLFSIAQRTRSSLEATYNVYGKLETVIKQLGGTQQQALSTTETLNQAIALTSLGAAQDAAAILQFSQALSVGVLRGDEFRSVMENSPGLAKALADGLGVPTTALHDLAEAGQLTADKLVNALGKVAPQVAEQFAQLPLTVSGAMTQVNNALLQFVGQSNGANLAATTIANTLKLLADNFNAVADTAVLLGGSYLLKVANGALQSASALSASAQAAKAKAAADASALQVTQQAAAFEERLAAIRIKSAEANAKNRLATANAAKAEAEAIQQKNIAAQAELAAETQQVALKVKLLQSRLADARAAVEEARLQKALAVDAEQRIVANQALLQSQEQVRQSKTALNRAKAQAVIYNGELAAANKTLADSEKQVAVATETAANAAKDLQAAQAKAAASNKQLATGVVETEAKVGLLSRALGFLSGVLNKIMLLPLAGIIAEWGLKFEWFYQLSMRMQEGLAMAALRVHQLLNLTSARESAEQVKQLHAEFNALIEKNSASSKKAAADVAKAEEQKAQATEQANLKAQESMKAVGQSYAALTKLQDDQNKTQLANLDLYHQQRLLKITESRAAEKEKGTLTFAEDVVNYQKKLELFQQHATAKLALLDKLYGDEKIKTAGSEQAKKDIEKAGLEGRKVIFGELQQAYQQTIGAMIAEEKKLADEAQQLAEKRKGFERETADQIREIRQAGMTDEQVRSDQEWQLTKLLSEQKRALQQGDLEAANRAGQQAAELAKNLAMQAETAYKSGQTYANGADGFIQKFKQARDAIAAAMDQEAAANAAKRQMLQADIEIQTQQLTQINASLQSIANTLAQAFGGVVGKVGETTQALNENASAAQNAQAAGTNLAVSAEQWVNPYQAWIDTLTQEKAALIASGASQDELAKVNGKLAEAQMFAKLTADEHATAMAKSGNSAGTAASGVGALNEQVNNLPKQPKTIYINADTHEYTDRISAIKAPTASVHTVDAEHGVSAALAQINTLNGNNTESTHTIHVVEDRTAAPALDAAPAQATGGPAGMPTGQPWRFAEGGWARLFGKLAGYGGGDRIKALLEPGEFIVRKEAVQKLGVPALQAINQGQLPDAPIQRARGGLVDFNAIDGQLNLESKKKALDEIRRILGYLSNSYTFGMAFGHGESAKNTGGILAQMREVALGAGLGDMLPNLNRLADKSLQAGQNANVVVNAGIDILGKQLEQGGEAPKSSTSSSFAGFNLAPKMPTISMPAIPSLQPAAAPAVAAPAKTVTVQFKAPDGGQVGATFGSESDVNKMLDMIKQSGMRVGVA